jgi:hypothetical protein
MSAAAVEALQERLDEARSWQTHCAAQAAARAAQLEETPSVELVKLRDDAAAVAEVARLETAKVERELREAQERARQDVVNELLEGASAIQERASRQADRVWSSLAEHEEALAGLETARHELRRLNGKLHLAGYRGEALQLAARPQQPEYRRRIAKLEAAYARCTHPLMLPSAPGE